MLIKCLQIRLHAYVGITSVKLIIIQLVRCYYDKFAVNVHNADQ